MSNPSHHRKLEETLQHQMIRDAWVYRSLAVEVIVLMDRGQSCTNFQVQPLKWDCSKGDLAWQKKTGCFFLIARLVRAAGMRDDLGVLAIPFVFGCGVDDLLDIRAGLHSPQVFFL
jgi:hypothetical protein